MTLAGEIKVILTSSTSSVILEWIDNGIGMDKDVLSSYFARAGCSWYRSRQARQLGSIDSISKFGVGILSCFSVSRKLSIETRKEPQVGGSLQGLVVDIPKQESHFRIRSATTLPVGTKIRLEIPKSRADIISIESICIAVESISKYVRHRVTISVDEVLVWESHGEAGDCRINISEMRGDAATNISNLTATIAFPIGDKDGDYNGHYAAVIPTNPKIVRSNTDSSLWTFEGINVELDDVLVDSEQALFVKGVACGPVSHPKRHPKTEALGVRHTSWIMPKLMLNVLRPNLLDVNLARTSAELRSKDLIDKVWREVAEKLSKALPRSSDSASDTATLIGTCALFGAIPDSGLDSLVTEENFPLLILRREAGLVWATVNEFAGNGEFVEAPFELGYGAERFSGLGLQSGLHGWDGPDALFPRCNQSFHYIPWLRSIIYYSHQILFRQGWCPVRIQTVRQPASEKVPLVCRVWSKGRDVISPLLNLCTCTEASDGERQSKNELWRMLKKLYSDAPELMHFPPELSEFAAFGSRYWNVDHPKIIQITSALCRLSDRVRLQQLAKDKLSLFNFLTSNTFYGYVVPARYSGITLAIDLPNRLLEIARIVGVGDVAPLVKTDFVPGTLEGYKNPYHYRIEGWDICGTGLGTLVKGR